MKRVAFYLLQGQFQKCFADITKFFYEQTVCVLPQNLSNQHPFFF